jgi:hypothetical protein
MRCCIYNAPLVQRDGMAEQLVAVTQLNNWSTDSQGIDPATPSIDSEHNLPKAQIR